MAEESVGIFIKMMARDAQDLSSGLPWWRERERERDDIKIDKVVLRTTM
jgi:hypothetical protein